MTFEGFSDASVEPDGIAPTMYRPAAAMSGFMKPS